MSMRQASSKKTVICDKREESESFSDGKGIIPNTWLGIDGSTQKAYEPELVGWFRFASARSLHLILRVPIEYKVARSLGFVYTRAIQNHMSSPPDSISSNTAVKEGITT